MSISSDFLLLDVIAYMSWRCVLQIGLFSSLPYAFLGLFALTSGLLADCLNLQDCTTLTVIRKVFTCSGQFTNIVSLKLML